jgi:hypothetical protein
MWSTEVTNWRFSGFHSTIFFFLEQTGWLSAILFILASHISSCLGRVYGSSPAYNQNAAHIFTDEAMMRYPTEKAGVDKALSGS